MRYLQNGICHKDVSGILRCDKCPDAVANKGLLILGVLVVALVMCVMVFDTLGPVVGKAFIKCKRLSSLIICKEFMINNMDVPWHIQ